MAATVSVDYERLEECVNFAVKRYRDGQRPALPGREPEASEPRQRRRARMSDAMKDNVRAIGHIADDLSVPLRAANSRNSHGTSGLMQTGVSPDAWFSPYRGHR
jgi:hypothetical protein